MSCSSRIGSVITFPKFVKKTSFHKKVGQQIKLFVNPFAVEMNVVEKRLLIELVTLQCNFSLESP